MKGGTGCEPRLLAALRAAQQPGRLEYHGHQVVCHTTGFIEKQFLDYARN